MGKSNDPIAYAKVKGVIGEAIFKNRANDLAATGIKAKGPYIGVPSPHYLGGSYVHGGVEYQVDVQSIAITGPASKTLGLPNVNIYLGIAHHNFDGSYDGMASYGSMWRK